MEKHNSGIKQGFHSKTRIVGLPSKKPPPKTAKKWAMTAEAQASYRDRAGDGRGQ